METDYRRLKADWETGSRDRDGALHLLFLAWMHWADPPFVTGMEDDPEAAGLWRAIGDLDYLGDWHTHPDGVAALSPLDRKTLHNLGRKTPDAIMAIAAPVEAGWGIAAW